MLSLLLIGKTSQQCQSDISGPVDHGVKCTHSLGHKRAPLTGHNPQSDKVGTLPRRRDTDPDSKLTLSHPQPLFVR